MIEAAESHRESFGVHRNATADKRALAANRSTDDTRD
jgi:hypothetical protein